jgi:hypothetical protein
MTTFKILGAAAILSSALGGSAMAQEATQEPAALGQSHPFCRLSHGRLWRARHLARAVRKL